MAPVTNMVGKLLRGLINKPFTMEMSKTGRVVSVKNLDALFTGMFDVLPDATAEQKAQFRAQLEKSFGEASIRNNFQQSFPTLPNHKVGVNDTWSATNKIESNITASVATTYTVTQITDKAIMVKGEGIVVNDNKAQPVAMNGMTTTFNSMSGKLSTDYAFDKNTGWILSTKTAETISADVNITIPGGQTMNSAMTIIGDISIKP